MTRPSTGTDKFVRVLKAALNTAAVVYPFYALISRLSVLDTKILKSCSGAGGCTFIRYWGTPELPRSAPKFLPDSNTTDRRPVFVTLRNGNRSIEAGEPNWFQRIQREYTHFALVLSDIAQGGGHVVQAVTGIDVLNETNWQYKEPLCPGMDAESMVKMCEEDAMKRNVKNHLEKAASLRIYLTSIPMWAALRLTHDVLLISEAVREEWTLIIGYASVIPQLLAFAAGFLWAIGAAEVFWSPSLDPAMPCGCYYELLTIPMFVLISTPMGLYLATRDKLCKLGYAALFGDYLYCTSYRVPYRVVSQYNADTTYGFLSMPVENEGVQRPASKTGRTIPRCKYTILSIFYGILILAFNLTALYFVYGFAFPILTVRFYDAVVVKVLEEGYQFEDFGAMLFGAFLLSVPVYVCLKQGERLRILVKACMNEMNRMRAVSGHADVDARHFKRYSLSIPCLTGVWASIGLHIQTLIMIAFSFLALWMVLPLSQGQEAQANTAGDLGAAGFFLMTASLNSWVPSDTPLTMILLAIRVKGGHVPQECGLQDILDLDERKPQLGLRVEAACAQEFVRTHAQSPMALHGLGLEAQDYANWAKFLDDFLESKADAPYCGFELLKA